MMDYISNKSIESLNSALTQTVKVINQSYDILRNLKNDSYFVEYNEDDQVYTVCNETLSIYNQEILEIGSKEPKIIYNEK